jgi:non-homologous end joining protein Ku
MTAKIVSHTRWTVVTIICGGAVLALAGCASETTQLDAVSAAELAVDRATEAKAAQHAPLELRLAQEKLERARSSMNENEHEDARRQAEQARVDARLAETKARSESASQQREEIDQTMDTLKREADRKLLAPSSQIAPSD